MVEYCEHGALRSYLRDCRLHEPYTDPRTLPAHPTTNTTSQETDTGSPDPDHNITANDLLSFAWQITKGMQYLSAMKLVHRDLAARNVLVASGKVIKISDFGLSRDIYEEDTYMKRSKGRIPVKWMAPESLYEQVYTTKSDVWSFGITLWEIVTLGATPYPGLGPEHLYHRLKSGYRMEKPAHCSDQLFRVMSWCWRTLPGDRPTFTQLVDTMEVMLKQNVEYLDLGGALDRHPILDDDTMDTDDAVSDKEGGYGSISRLTEDNAYLNPASHAQHNFDDVVCDDCTMRMIKEGDVTTECTKLLGGNQGDTDCVNNNSNSTKANPRPPLLYIQVEHDNSDEENDGQVVIPVL